MWYSPDEVEFYLVDFKKGVEFKTYATHALPHARAIAVESDREFGLSVLQRLDAELTRRGELFRKAGVQDLASLPRHDRARSHAAHAADHRRVPGVLQRGRQARAGRGRAARPPRAPGPRVRHPRAARLADDRRRSRACRAARSGRWRSASPCRPARPTRSSSSATTTPPPDCSPGPARRSTTTRAASSKATARSRSPGCPTSSASGTSTGVRNKADGERQRHVDRTPDAIVFEGNAPADIREERAGWPSCWRRRAAAAAAPSPRAYAGRAGRDQGADRGHLPPPERRRTLILIGQQDEAATGDPVGRDGLASPPSTRRRPGARRSTSWTARRPIPRWPARSSASPRRLPHDVKLVEWRAVADAIDEIADEIQRRRDGDIRRRAGPVYVIVYGLQRYRMLRKSEEEFSFSHRPRRGEEAADPGKQFADPDREGPADGHARPRLGRHRRSPSTARSTAPPLREFDNRILFQMSATDSSNLIDSPAANKLGLHRALAYSEEQGVMEKFRPYALPTRSGWRKSRPNSRSGRKANPPRHILRSSPRRRPLQRTRFCLRHGTSSAEADPTRLPGTRPRSRKSAKRTRRKNHV